MTSPQPRYAIPFAIVLAVALARPAWAYLDPGSGSLIFQILIAGGLSALFTLRMHWRRIRSFFGGRKSKNPLEEPDRDGDHQP